MTTRQAPKCHWQPRISNYENAAAWQFPKQSISYKLRSHTIIYRKWRQYDEGPATACVHTRRNHNDNIVRHYLIITPTNLTIRLNICTVSWSLWPLAATHNIWTQSHDEIAILKISLQSELLQLGPINIDHCAPAPICNLHISIVAGIVSSTAITTYKCDHVCNLPSQATLLVDYFLSKTSYRSRCYVENLVLNVRLK